MSAEDKFANARATIELFNNTLRELQEAPEKVTPQLLVTLLSGTTELLREVPGFIDDRAEAARSGDLKLAAIASQIVGQILTTADQVNLLVARWKRQHPEIKLENELEN